MDGYEVLIKEIKIWQVYTKYTYLYWITWKYTDNRIKTRET